MKSYLFSALLLSFLILPLSGCDEALKMASTALADTPLTNAEIGNGLKEALNQGISKGVDMLAKPDGYYKTAYKILLPAEVRKITDRLKSVPGFSQVEEKLIEKFNRGAEDAATLAKPIFVTSIKNMTITDATKILMGGGNSATDYLKKSTYDQLQAQFKPKVQASLKKVGALQYWDDVFKAYNMIPGVTKVNTDINDYVTKSALDGLYKMVAKEETNIRANPTARATELMKKVFAKQDK
jgi:Protein of unknown function (DUF4197)